MVTVLSVGGSIISPEKPDTQFLSNFGTMLRSWLSEDLSRKVILTAGGGAPARVYQKAYKKILSEQDAENLFQAKLALKNDEADWIGIMATRLNAQLLRAVFSDLCTQDVVYDPIKVAQFSGRVLVAAGWKPGFSTDTDAVLLAERFAAKSVINISNIEKVYTDDPRINPDAVPIDAISWADFRDMVGDEWVPGKNVPFDPIASKRAQGSGICVYCVGAKNIDNIRACLNGNRFEGTVIGV